ncbi:MAG TPA: hypothetical protein VF290_12840 [Pyrinomonadaceae bacterium]
MKNKKTRKLLRPPVMIVTAIAVVSIAAITVASRQSASGTQVNAPQQVTTATARKYTTVKVAGQEVQIDSQTGQMKPLSPEDAKKLADGVKAMLNKNKSSEGLVEDHHHDGSVSVDLQGRFQNVTVARANKDGTVTTSCVDNPRAAAAFFGIDPKLLEPERPTNPNQ